MKKILLAVKNIDLENYITEKTKETHTVVGKLVHRDGIVDIIENREPDLLIVRETIPGKEDLLRAIHYLSGRFPNLRIIFIAKDRPIGDAVLASLVSFRVYDILRGNSVRAPEIIDLINNPNNYGDVQHYQPAPSFDEETNRLLFEAPKEINPESKIIEVERKIYVGSPGENNEELDEDEEPVLEVEVEPEPEIKPEPKPKPKPTPKPKPVDEPKKPKSSFSGISDIGDSFVNMVSKVTEKPKREPKKRGFKRGSPQEVGKQKKIIAFVGGKRGVGTTTVAINTAIELAKDHKVIYLEMDRKTPSVSYWYDLGFDRRGIDTALESLSEGEYGKIKDSIVSMADLKRESKDYKRFPDIDFMFYSKEYLGDSLTIHSEENYKDLYLHLLLQSGYDYVIIDTISDMSDRSTMDALLYSNLVFTTITQDISSVGYQYFKIEHLRSEGLDISNKNIYILNNYIKSNFGPEKISDWLNKDSILLVPRGGNEFIESNYAGLPVVIYSVEPGINNAVERIVNTIKVN